MILVFSGGDYESLSPVWRANQVDLGGRLGFLRIARAASVPIVPLGIRGGGFTAPLLLRSKLLATLLVAPRLLGTKRWALSVLGLVGAALIALYAPWSWPVRAAIIVLWLGSTLVFLPWIPWALRFRIVAPLAPTDLFSGELGRTDEGLRVALGRVERAMQGLIGR